MKLERFFEKFKLFADAPNAVAKMRELVLELAVQGRLSTQRPGDGVVPSASEFRKNAATLASSLGLRSPIESAEVTEPPFDVPLHWRWMALSDIGAAQTGTTPSKTDHAAFNGDIPFIKPADILPDSIDYSNESLTRHGAESGSRLAPCGSLLMVCIGTIGKCNLIERECAFNQQINALTPVEYVDSKYLLIAARSLSFQKTAWQKSSSTTLAILNKGKWLSIPLPIPPLAEQKRIVAKVDELMALCDRLEAQQQERDTRHAALARASLARFAEAPTPANLDFMFHQSYTITPADLRKSILTLAVQGKLVPQDPNHESAENLHIRIHEVKELLIKEKAIKRVSVEQNPGDSECELLPTGWMWTRLGNVFDVRDGTHDTPKYTSEGFPLITSKNIYSGRLSFEGVSLISEEDHRKICERSRVERGDILFAMIGSIGNPVIVDTDREFSIKNVALFKYYAHADSEPRFLLQYLKLVSEEIKEKASGAVQSFVSLGFLRNYPFYSGPQFLDNKLRW